MGLFSGRSGDGDDDDDDAGVSASPWENRGYVASAIVIGAVVVCVIVFLVVGRNGGDDQSGAGPTPVTTAPTDVPTDEPTSEPTEPPATPGDDPTSGPVTPPPVNNATGGCKAKNPDQRIPRSAPAAVSWQFETNMLIPLQAQGGPATTDASGLRSCFAHSPTGAVLAAMVTLGQIRNPDLTKAVLQRRIAPGAGRTKALNENRVSPSPQHDVGGTPQYTGFKVVDYLPGRAIVALAVQVDFRSVASLPITLVWQSNDWKVVLQPDGSFNGEVSPDILGSLDGYVRFGGA